MSMCVFCLLQGLPRTFTQNCRWQQNVAEAVQLLTCGVFAEYIRRGIAGHAAAGSVDSRHSELVLAALQQTADLQTGVIDGVGLVDPCPPGPQTNSDSKSVNT